MELNRQNNAYKTPFEAAESEFIEKRSRFIGHVWRTDNEEEARQRIEEMRKKYYDARHNCWCYRIKQGGIVRYSDDGEPQGTAGQPMLNIFERQEVMDVCCVVTRYFGGVLLGAGGLTRAYSRAAKDTLTAAGIAYMRLWTLWDITCGYPLFERIKSGIAIHNGRIESADYGADIILHTAFPADAAAQFKEYLQELSAGTIQMTAMGEKLLPGERENI